MYISAKTRHERNNCATNKNRDLAQSTNELQVHSKKRKLENSTASG